MPASDKEYIDDIDSASDHQDTENEAEGGQQQQAMAAQIPEGASVVPDLAPEVLDADVDLTGDLPEDSENIDLIHLKIRSMEDLNLQKFNQIKSVCLRSNLIDSIAPLKYITCKDSVEELDFYDNRFNHISKHVNEFPNLKNLDLSFNKLKHIKNIDKLTNLENLYLIENKIEKIENLETLTQLSYLELGGNRIREIPDLSYLQNLEQLWLGKNMIYKIEGLQNLTKLRVLSLQANRITKLEGLETLTNLEELYVSSNGITKLEGLQNCSNLQILDIGYNKLTKLENLENLSKLTDLWCSYNFISDFKNIESQLKNASELECVYMEHNPVQTQNETSYRRKLKLILPQLKKIDATYCN